MGTNRVSSCIVEGQWANRAGTVITSGQWSGVHKERVVRGGAVGGLTLRLLFVRTRVIIRVSHFYTFFELSLVLLTTQAHGL